ncbi:uncharacterized protein si:dkey-11f4.20 [Triplophysa rosa]|uniref:T-cell surface antigen CD2 n=1 Tax=Triplophysa rosa TaxID=992332 RepID=A0A9W7WUU5_TRIRA|nr:uncharacterized protein si:dkey-11f4.20 [Triplophysa rosa]KAI7808714.1 putative T-cell surface antigen CD2 [Triplophysa rosa]
MTMMQNVTILLFIAVFLSGALGSKAACTYRAVGDTFVIPLNDAEEEIPPDSSLTWTHNETVRVYLKRGSNVRIKTHDINTRGSLILENVQIIHSGKYTARVYNKDGTLRTASSLELCVRDPVLEPTVTVKCEENGTILTCRTSNNTETTVLWIKNGKETLNVSNTVLHVHSSELKHRFSCRVRNEISEKTSKDVPPVCFHTGPTSEKSDEKNNNNTTQNTNDDSSEEKYVFGLDLWWMLVLVTGVGIVMLIIVCLVCVCCQKKRRKAREEEEYRLTALVSSDQSDQKTERSERLAKSQRPLPPVPVPRCPPSPPYM